MRKNVTHLAFSPLELQQSLLSSNNEFDPVTLLPFAGGGQVPLGVNHCLWCHWPPEPSEGLCLKQYF